MELEVDKVAAVAEHQGQGEKQDGSIGKGSPGRLSSDGRMLLSFVDFLVEVKIITERHHVHSPTLTVYSCFPTHLHLATAFNELTSPLFIIY